MRIGFRSFVVAGLAVALVLVFAVAPHASSSPDGLEQVAATTGIDRHTTEHALAAGPLGEYRVDGVDDAGLGTGLAGAVGVIVTFALGAGLLAAVRVVHRRADRGAAT